MTPPGLTAFAAFTVFGVLHHLVKGPNRVTRTDEEKARRMAEE